MERKHKVRVRDGFSDRNNIECISKEFQINDLNYDTRIVLFNAVNKILDYQIASIGIDLESLAQIIIENLFNEVYKCKYKIYEKTIEDISEMFKCEEYHVVLTMIEFLCDLVYESKEDFLKRNFNISTYARDDYLDVYCEMNKIFEKEFVFYRFVNRKIVKIINDAEIEEISYAVCTPYDLVNRSISKSIDLLSENGNKDYENSIKESITALEQVSNILLGTSGLVLSNAIEQILNKYTINEHLKNAIKEIYRYSNDSNTVRHGNNKKKEKISFNEAKLMLVLCSGIINYLISLIDN